MQVAHGGHHRMHVADHDQARLAQLGPADDAIDRVLPADDIDARAEDVTTLTTHRLIRQGNAVRFESARCEVAHDLPSEFHDQRCRHRHADLLHALA